MAESESLDVITDSEGVTVFVNGGREKKVSMAGILIEADLSDILAELDRRLTEVERLHSRSLARERALQVENEALRKDRDNRVTWMDASIETKEAGDAKAE